MKVILDTNVIISASVFGGISADILDFCYMNYQVYVSDIILAEFKKVLLEKMKVPLYMIEEKVKLFQENFIYAKPTNKVPDICRDKDDNNILQLCDYINADFIITGDKEFRKIEIYNSRKILSPREFWTLLKK